MTRTKVFVSPYAAAALLAFLIGCGGGGVSRTTSLAFASRMDLPTNGTAPEHVVIADFNGDGKLDIAVSGYNSFPISVFLNKGDGTFNGPIVTAVAPSDVGWGAMVVGDFNEDGIRDLVV